MKTSNGADMSISMWRNNKNREIYVVEDDNVTCATNGHEGTRMVIYYKVSGKKFCRTYDEFIEKFTRMDGGWCSMEARLRDERG